MNDSQVVDETVGPVLEKTKMGRILIEAISQINNEVQIIDQGSYVRVLTKRRCVLSKKLVEQLSLEPFYLPQDLEPLMPSFKGTFFVDENQATWQFDEGSAYGEK